MESIEYMKSTEPVLSTVNSAVNWAVSSAVYWAVDSAVSSAVNSAIIKEIL